MNKQTRLLIDYLAQGNCHNWHSWDDLDQFEDIIRNYVLDGADPLQKSFLEMELSHIDWAEVERAEKARIAREKSQSRSGEDEEEEEDIPIPF